MAKQRQSVQKRIREQKKRDREQRKREKSALKAERRRSGGEGDDQKIEDDPGQDDTGAI